MIGADLIVAHRHRPGQQPAGHRPSTCTSPRSRARASSWSTRSASRRSIATGCRRVREVGAVRHAAHGRLLRRASRRRHRLHARRAQGARRDRRLGREVHRGAHRRLRPSCAKQRANARWEEISDASRPADEPTSSASPRMYGARQARRARLFDGPHAVRVRRRQREDGGQPGARARQDRARRRPASCPSAATPACRAPPSAASTPTSCRARIDITDESCAELRAAVGARHPARRRGSRRRMLLDARRARRIDVLYLVGGNLPRHDARSRRTRAAALRARQGAHPPGHRAQHVDAGRRRGDGAACCPRRPATSSGRRHLDLDRAAHPLHAARSRGPRIAEARAEWEIPALIGRALEPAQRGPVRPDSRPPTCAREMARADAALRGHRRPRAEGQCVQWGGARARRGRASRTCPTAARGSRWSTDPDARRCRAGKFVLATRRGKQFNSITYGQKDPITGARPRATWCCSHADDLKALGLEDGDRVVLRSRDGSAWKRRRARPMPPPAPAGVLARGQRAARAQLRSGLGRARLQRLRHRRETGRGGGFPRRVGAPGQVRRLGPRLRS